MAANSDRIIYATQAVGIGSGITNPTSTAELANNLNFEWLRGVQSVSVSTNFNTEQLFELGQLQVYQNVDEVPNVELTIEKVIDGYKLLYLSAVGQAGTGNVLAAAKKTCDAVILVYPDTATSSSGTNVNGLMYFKTLRVSNVSYTFNTDGNFTESLTLVGNDKLWKTTPAGSGYTTPYVDIDGSGDTPLLNVVGKRNNIIFGNGHTVVPSTISGIARGGSGNIRSITIAADFGREDNFELGSYRPYSKFVTVPLQTTCDFEVLSTSGDWVSASGDAPRPASKEEIVIECDLNTSNASGLLKIDLGKNCRLNSVNYGGGDSGGGNVTNTYNYISFNYFKVSDSYTSSNAYWS